MNVDYINIARGRRLTALEVLQRRQSALPNMGKMRLARLKGDGKIVPIRQRIANLLDPAGADFESLSMLMHSK